MLIYKGVACQVEDHFYIGIQCNILWIIKDTLIAGADAIIFIHFLTVVYCISPEENRKFPVIRVIRYREFRQLMGRTISGSGCRAAADPYISSKAGKKDNATGALLAICISLCTVSLDNSSWFCGSIADSQFPDGVSWNASDRFTPFRCLWNAVVFTH